MLRNFEIKLENIKSEIYRLGISVIEANKYSVEAVKIKDDKLFQKARIELSSLEEKASNIDNLIVTALALYSPEAKDLRELVSYLKITNEIVRAGSNTKSFIKSFSHLMKSEIELNKILEYSIPLHRSSIMAFETAMEMVKLDNDDAIEEHFHKTVVEESKTDDLYAMIEKNLLKMITKKHELSKDYFDALSSVRKLEKVAGRALSIANLLVYAEIGGEINKI